MAGEDAKEVKAQVKAQAKAVEQPEEVVEELDGSTMGALSEWMREQAPWWAMSFTVHMVVLAILFVVLGHFVPEKKQDDIPSFDEAQTPPAVVDADLKKYEI